MSKSNVAPVPHLNGAVLKPPAGRLALHVALVGLALQALSVAGYFGSGGLVHWQAAHNALAALVPGLWLAGGYVEVLALVLGLLRWRAGGHTGVVVALVGLLVWTFLSWGVGRLAPF